MPARQADGGGVLGREQVIGQAADPFGRGHAHRHAQHVARELGGVGQLRGATGEHQSRRQAVGARVLAQLLADVDLTGTLRAIRAPTLVIAGEDDVAIPPAHGEAIAAATPGSSVILVPDAAHLVNVERSEVVADALVRHLADDPTADPRA